MAIRKLDVRVVAAVGGVEVGARGEGYEILSALFLQILRSLSVFPNKELKCVACVFQATVRPLPAPFGAPGVTWATAGSRLFMIMCMMAAAAFVRQGYCCTG